MLTPAIKPKQFTLAEVQAECFKTGLPTDTANRIWLHFQAQEWKRANGQYVTDLPCIVQLWKLKEQEKRDIKVKAEQPKKQELFCFVCHEPAIFHVKERYYLCERCRDLFKAAPPLMGRHNKARPKLTMEIYEIENMIKKEQAKRPAGEGKIDAMFADTCPDTVKIMLKSPPKSVQERLAEPSIIEMARNKI